MLSLAGQKFKAEVVLAVQRQGRPAKALGGRIDFRVWAYPPDRRRRDLSNLWKILEDSLTSAGVWEDDSQIDHEEMDRMPPTLDGAVRVRIGRM